MWGHFPQINPDNKMNECSFPLLFDSLTLRIFSFSAYVHFHNSLTNIWSQDPHDGHQGNDNLFAQYMVFL